jgi:putative endonuclease
MFYYTYVLKCTLPSGKSTLYVGHTSDLKKRIYDHQTKSTKTTKMFDQIELVYYEACRSKTDAIRRERQLKTGFGRGYLKKRLENDKRV